MRFDGAEGQLDMIREIAEGLTDPVFLVDKSRNVWYHNRAFEAVVGVRMSSRKYAGTPCNELLGLEICENDCIMKQTTEHQQSVCLAEIAGASMHGEPHNFHITAIPLANGSGAAFGALVFLRDITAETQIHKKYKELIARNTAVSLAGKIEQGNIVDIVQLVAFLQKTGRLTLHHQHHKGELLFDNGQMVSITLDVAHGEKALGRLFAWEDGTFSFEPEQAICVSSRLTKSSDFLLMDAVREKDELASRQNDLPALDAKPTISQLLSDPDVSELAWRVHELVGEGKTVSQMLDACEESDARILRTLLELRDRGILQW